MTRLHADPVEVRTEHDLPHQFLWRDRLYVVRAVLSRWTEAGGWWEGTTVTALHTGASIGTVPGAVPGTVPGTAPEVGSDVDDRERSWWRVEADSGRAAVLAGGSGSSGGSGVYDLCLDPLAGSWSLARVLD